MYKKSVTKTHSVKRGRQTDFKNDMSQRIPCGDNNKAYGYTPSSGDCWKRRF